MHSGARATLQINHAWCTMWKLGLLPDCFTYTTKYNLYPLHLLFYHSYSDSFHCWFSGRPERVIPSPQLLPSVRSPALFWPALALPLSMHGPCWWSCVLCVPPTSLSSTVSESPLSFRFGFLREQRPDECISFPFLWIDDAAAQLDLSQGEENEPRVPELQDFQGKDMSQISYLGEEWYQNSMECKAAAGQRQACSFYHSLSPLSPLDHVLVEWVLPHPSFLTEKVWYFSFPRCGDCPLSTRN